MHAQTVCSRLFFPHPSQEPGNEAMSLGDQFIVSRNKKGGTGGGVCNWYVHPKGENSMAVSGFGCKNPLG